LLFLFYMYGVKRYWGWGGGGVEGGGGGGGLGGGIALHQSFCLLQIGFTQLSQLWAMPSKEFNSFEKLVH